MQCDDVIQSLAALAVADTPHAVERSRRTALNAAKGDAHYMLLIDAIARKASRVFELERLATEDSLTGLANRRSFNAALGREFARRRRGRGPAVVMIDLDCLKTINDEHGHGAGDEAIRLTAEACVEAVRGGDLVARLGGDELAVLLPDTDAEGARAVAERIRATVETQQVCGVPLRASLGVAIAGPDGDDHASVVQTADARMYQDKRRRKEHILRLVA